MCLRCAHEALSCPTHMMNPITLRRVRTHSESIAFFDGGDRERTVVKARFHQVFKALEQRCAPCDTATPPAHLADGQINHHSTSLRHHRPAGRRWISALGWSRASLCIPSLVRQSCRSLNFAVEVQHFKRGRERCRCRLDPDLHPLLACCGQLHGRNVARGCQRRRRAFHAAAQYLAHKSDHVSCGT